MRLSWRLLGAAGLVLALGSAAVADDGFFKGKTIKIVVGFGAGGGYDLYARLLGRYLGDHIPGKPNVVVQNMEGAGSVRAANYVYAVAPKDGTYIAAVNQNMPMYALLGGPAAQFDPRKLVWLGTMGGSNSLIYTWHTSPVKTFEDAQRVPVRLGGTDTTSDSFIYPTLANELAKTKFQIINGYSGGSRDVQLALQRGEVDGRGGNSWSSLLSNNKEWIENKLINILLQIGLTKEPDLPTIPLLQEYVTSEHDRLIADLVSLPTVLGYSNWIAPGVPDDRVAALRKAYEETVRDPRFLAEANKRGIPLRPASGAETEATVNRVVAVPQAVADDAARMLGWKK